MKKIFAILFSVFLAFNANAATLINDTELENKITEIILPVARAADIPEKRLKVYIVNDDDFNAFVRGGEDVFVYTGLLKQIKNPNALRAVVAHELGHTIGGHMVQISARMHDEMVRTMIIQALGVGLMVAGGNPNAGMGVMAGASGIAQQSLLSFSRDEERMADDMAVDLMTKANQDPNGLIEVFEQMRDITGEFEKKVNPSRINHPLTGERINNAKAKIGKLKKIPKKPASVVARENSEYEMLRAKLIGYLNTDKNVITQYPYSNKSDAAVYARAIANMRAGDLKTAKTGTQTLINSNPNNPYFYELLGDIEYQFGAYDDSVNAYEKSLNLAKNAPQIETALALVLSERKKPGDTERATELCKRVILQAPAPLAYWILARVSDGGVADWAMAEFYNMNNDAKNAKKYAKLAQKKSKKDSPEYIKSGDILKKN
ncbi:MAG: M48 family metalloprotease [Alphaproteobacteria bacterium]|nr:M48 family metalloprotease [Alphaproteobacteria bacterium]